MAKHHPVGEGSFTNLAQTVLGLVRAPQADNSVGK